MVVATRGNGGSKCPCGDEKPKYRMLESMGGRVKCGGEERRNGKAQTTIVGVGRGTEQSVTDGVGWRQREQVKSNESGGSR